MAHHPPNAVMHHGARRGDILVGIGDWNLNSGMRIRLLDQLPPMPKGSRLEIPIELLSEGNGKYSEFLRPYVSREFRSAKQLHDIVCEMVGKKFLHFLNAGTLQVETSYAPSSTGPDSSDTRKHHGSDGRAPTERAEQFTETDAGCRSGVDIDISSGGNKGYVYVLTNAAMNPSCLKIGMTTRTSEQRAREISSGTGVPCPFQVAFEEQVNDCHAAERILHKKLSKYRMQTNREFFHLPLKDAIRVVQDVASSLREDVDE